MKKVLIVAVLVAFLLMNAGCSKRLTGEEIIEQKINKISAPKLLKPNRPKLADLTMVKQYYTKGDYINAGMELKKAVGSGFDPADLELLRWAAKVTDKVGSMPEVYYYSGWLYFADDRPNTIWNAKEYIFNPSNIKLILIYPELLQRNVSPRIFNGATITAAYVAYQGRLEDVKQRGVLAKEDKIYFDNLERIVEGIDEEIAPDKYDLATSIAIGQFQRLRVELALLNDKQFKKSFEDTFGSMIKVKKPGGNWEKPKIPDDAPIYKESNQALIRLKAAIYNMVLVHLDTPQSLNACQTYPDVMHLAGEAMFECGKYKKNKVQLKQALELLKQSQKLKPIKATQVLITRCTNELVR